MSAARPRVAARVVAIPVTALALVMGSAALGQLGERRAPERPLDAEALDTVARERAPAVALILGRALPAGSASAPDWQLIPGIGPRTAEAIVAARPGTLAEVLAVRGIGSARRATLSGLVRAEPRATDLSPTPERPCRSP